MSAATAESRLQQRRRPAAAGPPRPSQLKHSCARCGKLVSGRKDCLAKHVAPCYLRQAPAAGGAGAAAPAGDAVVVLEATAARRLFGLTILARPDATWRHLHALLAKLWFGCRCPDGHKWQFDRMRDPVPGRWLKSAATYRQDPDASLGEALGLEGEVLEHSLGCTIEVRQLGARLSAAGAAWLGTAAAAVVLRNEHPGQLLRCACGGPVRYMESNKPCINPPPGLPLGSWGYGFCSLQCGMAKRRAPYRLVKLFNSPWAGSHGCYNGPDGCTPADFWPEEHVSDPEDDSCHDTDAERWEADMAARGGLPIISSRSSLRRAHAAAAGAAAALAAADPGAAAGLQQQQQEQEQEEPAGPARQDPLPAPPQQQQQQQQAEEPEQEGRLAEAPAGRALPLPPPPPPLFDLDSLSSDDCYSDGCVRTDILLLGKARPAADLEERRAGVRRARVRLAREDAALAAADAEAQGWERRALKLLRKEYRAREELAADECGGSFKDYEERQRKRGRTLQHVRENLEDLFDGDYAALGAFRRGFYNSHRAWMDADFQLGRAVRRLRDSLGRQRRYEREQRRRAARRRRRRRQQQLEQGQGQGGQQGQAPGQQQAQQAQQAQQQLGRVEPGECSGKEWWEDWSEREAARREVQRLLATPTPEELAAASSDDQQMEEEEEEGSGTRRAGARAAGLPAAAALPAAAPLGAPAMAAATPVAAADHWL